MNLKKKVSFTLITAMMFVNSCFAFPVDFQPEHLSLRL